MSGKNNLDVKLSNEKSLHDYIEELTVSDVCERLFVTTYSIGEDSLRVIDELMQQGRIKYLTFIFNRSLVQNKYKLLLYALNIANEIYVADIHAKIVLFDNKVLLTSSNFNKIKRYEFFVISTDNKTVEYFKTEIKKLIHESEKIEI